jgi:hypothetical protein
MVNRVETSMVVGKRQGVNMKKRIHALTKTLNKMEMSLDVGLCPCLSVCLSYCLALEQSVSSNCLTCREGWSRATATPSPIEWTKRWIPAV